MKVKMILTALLIMTAGSVQAATQDNLKFNGTLVSLPCTIPDSDQKIQVHMGTTSEHDLYLNQTMPRESFVLHLEGCDKNITNEVSVMFIGTEDKALRGYLAIESSDYGASGVALGLENNSGTPIRVNKTSGTYALLSGSNELRFKAYVVGEPAAIKSRSIGTGNFSAHAILQVNYY